ncbi:MAG: hypothetical protein WA051_01620 [Minisyncoccia bacterium]
MTDVILEKLFGGSSTVKIMRLFLFNDNLLLCHEDIAGKVHENPEWVKNGLEHLQKLGFLKKKNVIKEILEAKSQKNGPKIKKIKKVKRMGWYINPNFPLTEPLRQFFYRANVVSPKTVINKLSSTGNLKLVAIAGMFFEDSDARLDLLIVGDNLKKSNLDKSVGSIEALLGREIRFAAFETPEFLYRYGMYDKLIRDVFDFRHEKILNKLAIFGDETSE